MQMQMREISTWGQSSDGAFDFCPSLAAHGPIWKTQLTCSSWSCPVQRLFCAGMPLPMDFFSQIFNVQKRHFLANSLPTFNKHSPRVL